MIDNKNKAYFSILLGAALWGCIGVFYRLLDFSGISSMQAGSVRVLIAAVLYSAFLFVTDRGALKIRFRDIWMFLGTGVLSLVCLNVCYFNAIKISGSMGFAAVLLYTAPIFVMLMSAVLFKEKLTPVKALALIFTFGGCVLVSGAFGGTMPKPSAIVFGLCSGFAYALYSIFGTYALRRYSSKTVTVWSFILGAVATLPFFPFADVGKLLTLRGAAGSLGLSIISCILPYVFYTYGLRFVEPGKASMLATLEPVVAALLGVLLFHDSATASLFLGVFLVVGSICLLNIKREKLVRKK